MARFPVRHEPLATARRPIDYDAVFHSDHGVQYTSGQFRAALAMSRIRPSIGRVGSCYDNAVAESFYNHDRLHSTIGHRTPHESRNSYSHQQAA